MLAKRSVLRLARLWERRFLGGNIDGHHRVYVVPDYQKLNLREAGRGEGGKRKLPISPLSGKYHPAFADLVSAALKYTSEGRL
jgi:hypothetical protein